MWIGRYDWSRSFQQLPPLGAALGATLRFAAAPPVNPRFAPIISDMVMPAACVPKGSAGLKVRARWVTLRARWVTLRARWVTLRARWVTLRGSLGDAKSSLGDAESSLGDAKSSLGDDESSLGDAKRLAGW
jgi:hypothetical protein